MAKNKKASRASSAKSRVKKAKAGPKKKPAVKVAAKKKKGIRIPAKAAKKSQQRKKIVAKKAVKNTIKKTAKKTVKKAVAKAPKKAVASKPVQKNGRNKSTALHPAKEAQKVKKTPLLPASSKVKNNIALNKTKPTAEEKLQSKAQRIMKELEETMDITKVKPRLKVPTYAPKPVKPAPVIKLPEPSNTTKEKYQLEFEFRSSKAILFSYLSDSSGLAGWFADEVRSHDDKYIFVWEGAEVHARQVAVRDQNLVRYQWTDENDGTYFQFEIREDDITSDIALLITDWAHDYEKDTNRMLWENQVQRLRQLLGSL